MTAASGNGIVVAAVMTNCEIADGLVAIGSGGIGIWSRVGGGCCGLCVRFSATTAHCYSGCDCCGCD